MKLIYVTSWFPTPCGVANFAHDLSCYVEKAAQGTLKWGVVALNMKKNTRYGGEVVYKIDVYRDEGFEEAADFINASDADLVSIQHEFGLFGRDYGVKAITLCSLIKKPKVINLHYVVFPFSHKDKEVLQKRTNITRKITELCDCIVVMTNKSARSLIDYIGVPEEKVRVIPHGAHRFKVASSIESILAKYGLPENKLVFGITGMIRPDKGIDYAISACQRLSKERNDFILWICGSPSLGRKVSRKYYDELKREVKERDLDTTVYFTDKFMDLAELGEVFKVIDVYIASSTAIGKSSSGTLAYAMAMGKSIISTEFVHAKEALAEGRGLFVPPEDSQALYISMKRLLDNPDERRQLAERIFEYAKNTLWPKVGKTYYNLFRQLIS